MMDYLSEVRRFNSSGWRLPFTIVLIGVAWWAFFAGNRVVQWALIAYVLLNVAILVPVHRRSDRRTDGL